MHVNDPHSTTNHLNELLERLEGGDPDVVGQPEDLDGAVVGAERHHVLPRRVERQAAPRWGLNRTRLIKEVILQGVQRLVCQL